MLSPFKDLHRDLARFLGQRRVLALLLNYPDASGAFVLPTLQALEEEGSDLFWYLVAPFESPAQWIEQGVEALGAEQRGIDEALGAGGLSPWPELPEAALDDRLSPPRRLQALFEWSHRCAPGRGRRRVWCLLPQAVEDPEAWAELLGALDPPPPAVATWAPGLRLILRSPGEPTLQGPLMTTGGLRTLDVDLGPGALSQALRAEAEDPDLPLDRRLDALSLLAHQDRAARRWSQALATFDLLIRYHRAMGADLPLALDLEGAGQTALAAGRPEEARRYLEAGLKAAMEAQAAPILLTIILGLGNLELVQGRWGPGGQYYAAAVRLAVALGQHRTALEALERQGLCAERLGHPQVARQSWARGLDLAQHTGDAALAGRLRSRLGLQGEPPTPGRAP